MWKETHIQEAMSTGLKEMNRCRQDARGREDLKGGSFSNRFILPSGKEDGIDIGYRAILVIFASFLIERLSVVAAKMTLCIQPMSHK
jgi:hypothetical protein